ncbi:MAG: hypothetical protein ACK501_02260 [Planctomycetota bacterium]|jgi:hypothetical protein
MGREPGVTDLLQCVRRDPAEPRQLVERIPACVDLDAAQSFDDRAERTNTLLAQALDQTPEILDAS